MFKNVKRTALIALTLLHSSVYAEEAKTAFSAMQHLILELTKGNQNITFLDYPYQNDQLNFPAILKFPEPKSGKKNKAEILRHIQKLVDIPSKQLAPIQELVLMYHPPDKKITQLSAKEKSVLKSWDKKVGQKFARLSDELQGYDYCKVELNFKGLTTNITQYAEAVRYYQYATLTKTNLDLELPLRIQKIVRFLDANHECTPTLIQAIIDLALRAQVGEFTDVLLQEKKITKQTAGQVAKLLRNKTELKNMVVDSLRSEFWISPYFWAKQLAPKLEDIQKTYQTKFPEDKNPVFDQTKLLAHTSTCYAQLIDAVEKENTSDESMKSCIVPIPKIPDASDLNFDLNDWNRLHTLNKEVPILYNTILQIPLNNMPMRIKAILDDLKNIEAFVTRQQGL